MKIGIDFDNTIVSYDELFFELARERVLIPAEFPRSKTHIRDLLRAEGREQVWTELQGLAYGDEIGRASIFPGVLDFFIACHERRIPLHVISHKTRQPYLGASADLHAAARGWLEQERLVGPVTGLTFEQVFFELTKEAKVARISALGCSHFIDDLPEFLALASFPAGVQRILFDPSGVHAPTSDMVQVASWSELRGLLLCEPTLV
jgi:hypothetical protein